MSQAHTEDRDSHSLYELADEEGRAWLAEIVKAFNEGGYVEAVEVFLADEAAVHGPE